MRLNKMLIIAAVLVLLLAACDSAATAEPTTEAAQGNLPRERQTSAADVAMGEGTDICGDFPDPDPQIFTAEAGDPLHVEPDEYIIGADQAAVTFILYGNLADAGTADTVTVLREVL